MVSSRVRPAPDERKNHQQRPPRSFETTNQKPTKLSYSSYSYPGTSKNMLQSARFSLASRTRLFSATTTPRGNQARTLAVHSLCRNNETRFQAMKRPLFSQGSSRSIWWALPSKTVVDQTNPPINLAGSSVEASAPTHSTPSLQQATFNVQQSQITSDHSSGVVSASATESVVQQHDRPEFVYPLTFGEPHEIIAGGHVPESLPHINIIESLLESLNGLGLPWWGAISALTIAFRLVVVPLNISLIRNSARLNSVRQNLESQGQIMSSTESSEEEKVLAADKYSQILKENKCHPLYNIVSPLVMAPMFLSVFLAVERICLHDPGCRGTGGLLWFLDLSSMDPTFMLPVLSAASWLLTIELGAAEARTELMKTIRSVIRFSAAVMVPVTAALPSGVFVYWITSNLFSLVQIYVMQRAPVRRFFGIHPRTSDQVAASNKPVTM